MFIIAQNILDKLTLVRQEVGKGPMAKTINAQLPSTKRQLEVYLDSKEMITFYSYMSQTFWGMGA